MEQKNPLIETPPNKIKAHPPFYIITVFYLLSLVLAQMFITKSASTMAALVFIALFLGMTGYSSATYCICKDGFSDAVLQKNIDYACGSGADCSLILQNGGCYQPNTVKAHCDYACNNYYQKKAQATGSCDFSGTATVTSTLPTTVVSGCTYPANPSQVTTSSSSNTPTTATATGADGMAPSSTNSTGSSNPSHHASFLLIAVTTLVLGFLVLWA